MRWIPPVDAMMRREKISAEWRLVDEDLLPGQPGVRKLSGLSRVIFLDIDGVLHGGLSKKNFEPDCLAVLEGVVERCSSEKKTLSIVLSSDWRRAWRYEAFREIHPALSILGFLSQTPTFERRHGEGTFDLRAREIQAWVERFKQGACIMYSLHVCIRH